MGVGIGGAGGGENGGDVVGAESVVEDVRAEGAVLVEGLYKKLSKDKDGPQRGKHGPLTISNASRDIL